MAPGANIKNSTVSSEPCGLRTKPHKSGERCRLHCFIWTVWVKNHYLDNKTLVDKTSFIWTVWVKNDGASSFVPHIKNGFIWTVWVKNWISYGIYEIIQLGFIWTVWVKNFKKDFSTKIDRDSFIWTVWVKNSILESNGNMTHRVSSEPCGLRTK